MKPPHPSLGMLVAAARATVHHNESREVDVSQHFRVIGRSATRAKIELEDTLKGLITDLERDERIFVRARITHMETPEPDGSTRHRFVVRFDRKGSAR